MTVIKSPEGDTKRRIGSRQRLPEGNVCASCGAPRGNVRKGWTPVTIGGDVRGWTCERCPLHDEPIRLEASGKFVAVVGVAVDGGKRKQLKRRFTDLSSARAWVAETKAGAAKTTSYVDPTKFTVQQIADRWLAHREQEVGMKGGIRRNTHSGYKSSLSSMLEILGDRVAREVTSDDIQAAMRQLATTGGKRGKPLTHRSLVYALGTLRQVYAYALGKWVLTDPAKAAKTPLDTHDDDQGDEVKRWTTAQLVMLREYVTTHPEIGYPWQEVGVRLTLCALRRSEVLGLDWRNVDVKAGSVRIVASRTKDGVGSGSSINGTKTKNSRRTVEADVIHPGTGNALRSLWLAQGRPAEGLVIRDAIGQPVQPDAFSRRFVALCKAAGVPVLTRIHNTRHTLATALKEAGVPDHQAAKLLGHDVPTYMRFYLVTDDEGAAEAAAVAGKLFAVV